MNSAHPAASASGRRETVPALGHADVPASDLLVGASEFAEYRQELDRLRAVRDRDLRDRLRRARGFVGADAAEEIAHIQEDNAAIDARIARLEALVRTATVLAHGPADGVATLGSTVEVEYERTGRRATYRLNGIASSGDAGSVSARSPVGQALMGRRAGDRVSVDLPSGRVEALRIVAISCAPAVAAA